MRDNNQQNGGRDPAAYPPPTRARGNHSLQQPPFPVPGIIVAAAVLALFGIAVLLIWRWL